MNDSKATQAFSSQVASCRYPEPPSEIAGQMMAFAKLLPQLFRIPAKGPSEGEKVGFRVSFLVQDLYQHHRGLRIRQERPIGDPGGTDAAGFASKPALLRQVFGEAHAIPAGSALPLRARSPRCPP